MARIRRTKAEIAAGITLEDKLAGITLESVVPIKKSRTMADLDTGPTLREEAVGAVKPTLKKKFEPENKKLKNSIVTSPYKVDKIETSEDGDKTIYKTRETVTERIVELPVVKEIRILNGSDGSSLTVEEIIENKLADISHRPNCEWHKVHLGKDFKSSVLTQLGKEGWIFAYVMDWGVVKDTWKTKPHTIFLYRLKK